MSLPLFQQKVASVFENYHFEVRGWTEFTDRDRTKAVFNKFISEVNTSRKSSPLETETVHVEGEVAFVKLKGGHGSSLAHKEVDRLCRAMVDPTNRPRVGTLTNRSLLGISPVNRDTTRSWNKAVFQEALDHGPQYLEDLNLGHYDHIPDWALVLAFAMVAGINIVGYPKPSRLQNDRTGSGETNSKITRLFGYDGVLAAEKFLNRLANESSDAPDLKEVGEEYDREMEKLEYRLKDVFDGIEALRSARKREGDLGRYTDQARDSCFSAVVHAAQVMLAHGDMLSVYLKARKQETTDISALRVAAAASSLTGVALSYQVVAAPFSVTATGTFLTTGAWPTVVALTNPAGLAVGSVALFLVALSVLNGSRRKEDILRYRHMVILIIRSCNAVNEASILADCSDSCSFNDSKQAKKYLNHAGNQAVVQRWEEFVKQETRVRVKSATDRKRQLDRFLKILSKSHETALRATLQQLKSTGWQETD